MKNSNVQEKSKGVVLFAFNTADVDYISIAEQTARLVRHTLNLPITLITDTSVSSVNIDNVICINNIFRNKRHGYGNGSDWRNGDRYLAYELSPYDETILIDSDYLVLDTSIMTILESTVDYRLLYNNQNPIMTMSGNMGELSLDFVWATVIAFKKTNKTKMLFDLVGRIQRNYFYYQQLYQIRERNFRNDYAFAIANNIISGYFADPDNGMPITMLTLDAVIEQIELRNNNLIIREKEKAHIFPKQNIHVMDKEFLLSDGYITLVDSVCNEK